MVERYETKFEDYRDNTHFMEIVDRDLWWHYYETRALKGSLDKINHGIPLHIIRSKGIEVKPDFDLKVTDLNKGNWNHKLKMFHDTGDGGIDFKVDVIIGNDETWGISKSSVDSSVNKWYYNYSGDYYPNKDYITSWLNWFYLNKRPVNIVTDAIDINNGTYIITSNTRKQTGDNFTVWTLEFTTYEEFTVYNWHKPVVNSASSSATPLVALRDCAKHIFISLNERKTGQCNRTMQQKLYSLGYLKKEDTEGWYNSTTMEAVKQFQRDMNKKGHNLLVDGVMGPVTLKVLIDEFGE